MRIKTMTFLAAAGLLSGCFNADDDPFSKTASACSDVTAIIAASAETPDPFASLRTEPKTFDSGAVIKGSWLTNATLDGHDCSLGEVSAFSPGEAPTQVLRCTYNQNAVFEEQATEDYKDALDYMKTCLGAEWMQRDKSGQGQNEMEMIFERQADLDAVAEGEMYMYPIQVRYTKGRSNGSFRSHSQPTVDVAFQFKSKPGE